MLQYQNKKHGIIRALILFGLITQDTATDAYSVTFIKVFIENLLQGSILGKGFIIIRFLIENTPQVIICRCAVIKNIKKIVKLFYIAFVGKKLCRRRLEHPRTATEHKAVSMIRAVKLICRFQRFLHKIRRKRTA